MLQCNGVFYIWYAWTRVCVDWCIIVNTCSPLTSVTMVRKQYRHKHAISSGDLCKGACSQGRWCGNRKSATWKADGIRMLYQVTNSNTTLLWGIRNRLNGIWLSSKPYTRADDELPQWWCERNLDAFPFPFFSYNNRTITTGLTCNTQSCKIY